MKKLFAVFVGFILISTLGACTSIHKYNGVNIDLWNEAIYSLLGYPGSNRDGIRVIETDEYGRKMYVFTGLWATGFNSRYQLISQYSDSNYVYYYPDMNYIISNKFRNDFDLTEIEKLKKENDWGKEINLTKCIKVKITNQKKQSLLNEKSVKDVVDNLLGNEKVYGYKYSLYDIDTNNKHLFCIRNFLSEDEMEFDVYVLILNNDCTYDDHSYKKIINNDYRLELLWFKEFNEWNYN